MTEESSMKILIIEDEHKIANSIAKGLEQEKHAVDKVYDGNEGLDFAQTETYDIIILDRMLPGIDGIDITKKLRAKNIHTPIIMLTAKGQLNDRVAGLDAGADDYLTKPFAFVELLARIRALTRRPKKLTDTVLQVDDLSLNTVTYEVKRANIILHLSAKEFTLLEYLMRHANKVIPKEQIMNHVWNYDADVLPNSVEAYIKHLRKKLDQPFNKPLIHTIRGFGYKIGIK